MAVDNKRYKLDLDATGGLSKDQTQWKGTVDTLDINGAFNLKLQNRPFNLEAGSERFPRAARAGRPWAAASTCKISFGIRKPALPVKAARTKSAHYRITQLLHSAYRT